MVWATRFTNLRQQPSSNSSENVGNISPSARSSSVTAVINVYLHFCDSKHRDVSFITSD